MVSNGVSVYCAARTTSLCGTAKRPAKERNDTCSSSRTSCCWRARGSQNNPVNFRPTNSEKRFMYVCCRCQLQFWIFLVQLAELFI